jgi:hypothetical protein
VASQAGGEGREPSLYQGAYETVKVDPEKFLLQLRTAYGLPVSTFHGVFRSTLGNSTIWRENLFVAE